MQDSDYVLIERYLAGDERAFKTLYDRHRLMLWRLAKKILHDPDAADDIVQDTFLQITLHLHRFNPGLGSFPRWSRTILWRQAVCLSQKWKRHRTYAIAELGYKELEKLPEPVDPQPTPDHAYMLRGLEDDLLRISESLSPTERHLIARRYLDNQTYPQIGQELGVCENTAKSRTRKATAQILPKLATLLAQ